MSLPQQGLLPLEYLIAAPLEALVRAQALSAQTTAQFVGEVGFETDKEGVARARMLDFEYTHPRMDPENPGNTIDTPVKVRVPLLSLLQVPNVTVDEASVELNLRIAGQQQVEPTAFRKAAAESFEAPRAAMLPIRTSPVRMVGSLTAPKLAEQSASMKVSIKLKQAPVPEGLAHIIQLLGDATSARPAGEQ